MDMYEADLSGIDSDVVKPEEINRKFANVVRKCSGKGNTCYYMWKKNDIHNEQIIHKFNLFIQAPRASTIVKTYKTHI